MRETKQAMMEGTGVPAKEAKVVARNTLRYRRPSGEEVIRLHHTDILVFANGAVTIDSGGWLTPTTRQRMNAFLPAPLCLYAGSGHWSLYRGEGLYEVPYRDGLRVSCSPPYLYSLPEEDPDRPSPEEIRRFVNGMKIAPLPSPGDCWLCACDPEEKRENSSERRLPKGDREHLLSHIRENYIHGSLLVNAMRWAGYRDEGISVFFHMQEIKTFKRVLRRYLRMVFGYPS